MSYSDLLRDPRWQKKRLEVLERAQFTCERCADDGTELHVHHTYYAKGRKPWEYDTADLLCLCKTCHAFVTARLEEIQRLMGAITVYPYAFDRVVGYMRAVHAENSGAETITPESYSEASGVADCFLIDPEFVRVLTHADGMANVGILRMLRVEVWRERRAKRETPPPEVLPEEEP